MKTLRNTLLATAVIAGFLGFGTGNTAMAGNRSLVHGNDDAGSQHRFSQLFRNHQHPNKPPKLHMGGSSYGPPGTPENPNKPPKLHMGGSSYGPPGTPENPNKAS
jgi:hypothetical protein